MTRTEYEAARVKAAQEYLTQAERDINARGRTARERASAQRRKARAMQRLKTWQRQGFWNSETELAYSMIYSQLPSGTPVSAL